MGGGCGPTHWVKQLKYAWNFKFTHKTKKSSCGKPLDMHCQQHNMSKRNLSRGGGEVPQSRLGGSPVPVLPGGTPVLARGVPPAGLAHLSWFKIS